MLAMPITGAALYRGEINAHVTWCILFATFIVARQLAEPASRRSARADRRHDAGA